MELSDQATLVIDVKNTSAEAFYVTTHTNFSTSGDQMPRNFSLITTTRCQPRLHTFADTFIELSEQDWLGRGMIVLLQPGKMVPLQVHLGTWAEVFCASGLHKLRVRYEGAVPVGHFSHPFLTFPQISNEIELTIDR